MQIALFTAAPGDTAGVDDLNRFLRGHRVLTLDRTWTGVAWSFCVTYQPGPQAGSGPAHGRSADKIDYKAILDVPTFARFSRLREVRKGIAEGSRTGSGFGVWRLGGMPNGIRPLIFQPQKRNRA